jgi:hypothetical protein
MFIFCILSFCRNIFFICSILLSYIAILIGWKHVLSTQELPTQGIYINILEDDKEACVGGGGLEEGCVQIQWDRRCGIIVKKTTTKNVMLEFVFVEILSCRSYL